MTPSPIEEPVTFHAGPLALEGRLGRITGAARAAVVCHPHPQYGGDMESGVVRAVADDLRAAGVATLRFNFRGVGASAGAFDHGRGERDDVRAALAFLRTATGVAAPILAGYSFGALVAASAADGEALAALALVAPPLAMAPLGALPPGLRVLLAAGDRDQYCTGAALETAARAVGGTAVVLPGADHFFGGRTAELAAVVTRFATGAPE